MLAASSTPGHGVTNAIAHAHATVAAPPAPVAVHANDALSAVWYAMPSAVAAVSSARRHCDHDFTGAPPPPASVWNVLGEHTCANAAT